MAAQSVIPTVGSLYEEYLRAVRVAIQQPPSEWTFKSSPGYRQVLEHVSPEQGAAFLEWAFLADVEQLSGGLVRGLAALNDSVGQPVRHGSALGRFSPSNWRYLCHALKVWQHIDTLGLDRVDIIEIGGGYGGLALYVRGLASLFSTPVRAYYLVDLPEVAILQHQVAQALNVSVFPLDGLDPDLFTVFQERPSQRQFLVSAYAFSEFDQETRDWYAERVIRYCDHGLMVWNFPDPTPGADGRLYGGPVYPFTDKPMVVTPDEPALYDRHSLVRW